MTVPKVLFSHEQTEWYTPPDYIQLIRRVIQVIDLDPASHPEPQYWIGAKTYYTKEDDGLNQPWFGNVFVNPPYSKTGNRSNQELWLEKLEEEYLHGQVSEAISLNKAALGYGWFSRFFKQYPCCLTYELPRFVRPGTDPYSRQKPAKLAAAFFYFGPNVDRFRHVFSRVGKVI